MPTKKQEMNLSARSTKSIIATRNGGGCQLKRPNGMIPMSLARCRLSKEWSILALMVLIGLIGQLVGGQCPVNTMTSFERISGVTVKDSPLMVLYTAPNISSLNSQLGLDLTRQLASLTGGGSSSSLAASSSALSMNIPITAECNNRCRRNVKCRAFLVDYGRHTCYSIEQPSSMGASLMRGPTPIHLVPTQERTSYFEKVCLNLPAVECERAWIYERVIGYHIHGYDEKIIEEVSSRLKCQEHCLNEREFKCRSGEYDYLTMQCRLSIIDRHIKPNSFRPTSSNVDYFENQCVPVGNQCDAFDRFEDMDLGRAEIMRSANTSDQCQQFCTQTIKAFICRSFTWSPLTGKCYLNSANTFMVGGLDRLISAPGLTYYQRNDCIDLKLECDTSAMTLNLRTNEPFRGRMYVRDDPNSCETIGRSMLSSSLSIPFQSHARCATREMPNRYSSVVVVQQHPLIQRKSDRYIKLVCDFQTANKTITSTYNVVANPWTSTALINATSFAPKIRLRITDKFGVDITGAKLGDELYLRIEAETESVYDMVARSVLAKSGTSDESIMLIDKDGCPTDYRIFPPLKKLNRRTIIGKFDAFKFSSDVVVRFQVDVQFCLNQCPITSCDQNLLLNSVSSQQLAADQYTIGNLPVAASASTTTMSPTQLQPTSTQSSMAISSEASVLATQTPQFNQHLANQRNPSELVAGHSHRNAAATSNYSSASNYGDNLSGNSQVATNEAHYFGPAASRHPSAPANQPQVSANYSSVSSLIQDSLVAPTSDPQIFDHANNLHNQNEYRLGSNFGKSVSSGANGQPEVNQFSGNKREYWPMPRQDRAQSQVAKQSVADSETSGDMQEEEQQQKLASSNQQNRSRRRRRRSANELEAQSQASPATRLVPLQREIIVESAPVQSSRQSSDAKVNDNRQHRAKSAFRDGRRSQSDDSLGPNGSVHVSKGNKLTEQTFDEPQQQVDNSEPALLCTTKHSLVLASLAFCAVQLFTIALCLITWMHKRDTKFKVKHPIQTRLY